MRMILALTAVGALAAVAATTALGGTGQPVYAYSAMGTTVTDKSVTVEGSHQKDVVLLADNPVVERINTRSTGCHWTKGPWGNSYKTAVGKTVWYVETVPGKLCPSKTSPTGWVKVAGGKTGRNCRNPAKEGMKMPGPVVRKKVKIVKAFTFSAVVKVRAVVSASGSAFAECSTSVGSARAFASAYGYGLATASASAKGKTKVRALAAASSLAISMVNEEDVRASARASVDVNLRATASAVCTGSPPPVSPPPPGAPTPPGAPAPPNPPQEVCPPNTTGTPPNCVPSKDGTQGPGTGTPGQPGGPGAGGSPGPGAGPMCRDASGDLVPGTPDASGNCPGVSSGGTTGGTTPAGPTPPLFQGQCLDQTTKQPRDPLPGEVKDQFDYCLVP